MLAGLYLFMFVRGVEVQLCMDGADKTGAE